MKFREILEKIKCKPYDFFEVAHKEFSDLNSRSFQANQKKQAQEWAKKEKANNRIVFDVAPADPDLVLYSVPKEKAEDFFYFARDCYTKVEKFFEEKK